MKVGLVAFHYPRPEHRDEMSCGSARQRTPDAMAETPGCLAAGCWVSEDGTARRDDGPVGA